MSEAKSIAILIWRFIGGAIALVGFVRTCLALFGLIRRWAVSEQPLNQFLFAWPHAGWNVLFQFSVLMVGVAIILLSQRIGGLMARGL